MSLGKVWRERSENVSSHFSLCFKTIRLTDVFFILGRCSVRTGDGERKADAYLGGWGSVERRAPLRRQPFPCFLLTAALISRPLSLHSIPPLPPALIPLLHLARSPFFSCCTPPLVQVEVMIQQSSNKRPGSLCLFRLLDSIRVAVDLVRCALL